MTSEHLLSFGHVGRNVKWREIRASITLFKFLIMEVSLSLKGWTTWVFFSSYGLLCHCVFVLRGRNDLIHKKIKVWFWKLLKCKMFSVVFWADTLEYNGYYADLRWWAKGVRGGVVKQQRLLAHASKWGRFLVMISEFFLTEMESLATHAAPPPFEAST